MEEDTLTPRACVVCGRWMTLQADSRQVYCSEDCARENLSCQVCSRFFAKGTGFEVQAGGSYCCEACAAQEHRFDAMFKETT